MNDISAFIVVKDDPPHLTSSIESIIDIVKEIVIINIGIDIKMLEELSRRKKVRIIEYNKEVKYVELIREEIKKYITTPYILYLDPDEVISPDLKNIIKLNYSQYDYISIPRKNYIFGKWIRHSRWWPDYQVRVMKKDNVVWSKEIHQPPLTQGNGLQLEADEKNAIIHYNYHDIDEYISKSCRYAKSEANFYIENNKLLSLDITINKSVSEFISRFFAYEGYKDGIHGFILAIMQMFYYFLVYFYYWEIKKFNLDPKLLSLTSRQYFKNGLKETNHWLINKKFFTKLNSIKHSFVNKILGN